MVFAAKSSFFTAQHKKILFSLFDSCISKFLLVLKNRSRKDRTTEFLFSPLSKALTSLYQRSMLHRVRFFQLSLSHTLLPLTHGLRKPSNLKSVVNMCKSLFKSSPLDPQPNFAGAELGAGAADRPLGPSPLLHLLQEEGKKPSTLPFFCTNWKSDSLLTTSIVG
jgi:hypothetical protein